MQQRICQTTATSYALDILFETIWQPTHVLFWFVQNISHPKIFHKSQEMTLIFEHTIAEDMEKHENL